MLHTHIQVDSHQESSPGFKTCHGQHFHSAFYRVPACSGAFAKTCKCLSSPLKKRLQLQSPLPESTPTCSLAGMTNWGLLPLLPWGPSPRACWECHWRWLLFSHKSHRGLCQIRAGQALHECSRSCTEFLPKLVPINAPTDHWSSKLFN